MLKENINEALELFYFVFVYLGSKLEVSEPFYSVKKNTPKQK